jgi:hypothetical protein
MKAKVLKRFKDKHTGELHSKGTTITISEERYEEIMKVGPFVEVIKSGKTKKKKETGNG